MSTPSPAHFVFVDFENVSEIDLKPIAGLPVRVTLLIGKNQRKLDLSLVQQIHRLSHQVALVEVGAAGRNALDLTLSYYLGQAVHQAPKERFYIVSKDKDYDALIAHLQSQEYRVTRVESFAALPCVPKVKKPAAPTASPKAAAPATVKKAPILDRAAKLLERFKSATNTNRPSSKTALLAHIKTALGKEATEPKVEALMCELTASKCVVIDAKDKVHYHPHQAGAGAAGSSGSSPAGKTVG